MNLRAAGTDPANPTAGKLVGTAEIEVPDQGFPDDEAWVAPLISVDCGEAGHRLFRFARGNFGFGPPMTPEYVETRPVMVKAVFT